MSDQRRLGLDLKDHLFPQRVTDESLVEMGDGVESQAVREFAGPHPEEAFWLACDQPVDLAGDPPGVHIDGDQGDIQVIL